MTFEVLILVYQCLNLSNFPRNIKFRIAKIVFLICNPCITECDPSDFMHHIQNACFHVGSFGTTTISCLASLLISSALEVRYWSIPINSKFVNVLLDIQETLITNKGKLAHFFAQKEFVKLYFILMDFADKIFGRHA